jgi:hypothetical protein
VLVACRRSFSLLADGYSFEATNKRKRKNTERQKNTPGLGIPTGTTVTILLCTSIMNLIVGLSHQNINKYYPVLHFAVKEG